MASTVTTVESRRVVGGQGTVVTKTETRKFTSSQAVQRTETTLITSEGSACEITESETPEDKGGFFNRLAFWKPKDVVIDEHKTIKSPQLAISAPDSSDTKQKKKSKGSAQSQVKAKEALEAHNEYRKKHGCSPLKLDSKLTEFSQEWAEKLAEEGKIYHRQKSDYGENIFCMSSSNASKDISGREPVDAWYSENKDFDYKTGEFSTKTGHFTQVVWKSSQKLGMGIATNNKGFYVVVCNYDPPGNYPGRFRDEVSPPK